MCGWKVQASRELLQFPALEKGRGGRSGGAVPETLTGALMCALLGGRWACNRGY